MKLLLTILALCTSSFALGFTGIVPFKSGRVLAKSGMQMTLEENPEILQNRRSFVKLAAATTIAPILAQSLPSFADDYVNYSETENGLRYLILKEGTGDYVSPGTPIKAHYTGWLDGFESEKKFDSSYDRRKPFVFPVGTGRVIKGWDEAFLNMKIGEKRRIIVPPQLGYGARGAGGVIPPNATLYFEVEFLGLN
mmetsp:Transcript_38782/g.51103  ORF Transcript_38782/g.51103 Transcript_38782/m.51103 type:complete len:195 (-) Transcript_38782:715-1299(-)|eukprot:CAMPEP_0117756642 /NCGR_PEP_ID=MMETSP0947-20121206/14213_1 /TAXON_ID=44440 /ORGANISM="Chattonella subsalsa, Strain CCMP2191" /LENGTH=194 /DNA_ID=CAMNT_0005576295 /DNA_START=82 /DNA_END=666 /DNA_ORIENTATION=+